MDTGRLLVISVESLLDTTVGSLLGTKGFGPFRSIFSSLLSVNDGTGLIVGFRRSLCAGIDVLLEEGLKDGSIDSAFINPIAFEGD
eukprot:11479163-Ditylum_brightwellii.AAC.1